MKTAAPKELPADQCQSYRVTARKPVRCTAKAAGTLTNPLGQQSRVCGACARPHLNGQSRGMGWSFAADMSIDKKD